MDTENVSTRMDRSQATPERIEIEIRRRLCATGYPVLRTIDCRYRDGLVVLRGQVPAYYYKQIAQSTLLTHPLVEAVVNLIDVSGSGRQAHPRETRSNS